MAAAPQPAAAPVSTRRLRRWRSAWKIERRIGACTAAPSAGQHRRHERLLPADDRRRAVGAGLERDQAVAREQAEVPDRVSARRLELGDLDRVASPRCQGSAPSPAPASRRATGPGVSTLTRFISRIHSSWRGMSATTAHVVSIGASTTASISSGAGASGVGRRDGRATGRAARRLERRRGRAARTRRSTMRSARPGGEEQHPGGLASRRAPQAVAGLHVHGGDRVGQDRGHEAEQPRRRARSPSRSSRSRGP